MTLGRLCYLAAAVLAFLAGIGSSILPNPMVWALFCLALGLFVEGYDLSLKRH